LKLFDRPIYAQRKHFIHEIASLGDVFDFLDDWPQDSRDIVYEWTPAGRRQAVNSRSRLSR
jgi:hypothetical protein